MSNHNASAQMLGYLYQVRCALAMLLLSENERSRVCIEKFDDIAFSSDNDGPEILVQTKHHINRRGDLTDTSVDLWRTLNVWMDLLHKEDVSNTKFIIITTGSAPEDSAASFLRKWPGRNASRAYEILKTTAEESMNASNKKYYESFLALTVESMQALLEGIVIIDGSVNIQGLVDSIKKSIRYSTRPEYEDKVFERVEGWWFRKAVEALCSAEPIFVSQNQVRFYICDVSAEYSPNNLPIDTEFADDIDIESFPTGERIFCEQLRLIAVRSNRIQLAIRDYYRAFTQRNNWIKDDLLYVDELEKYEDRLVDEWQHLFLRMQDELEDENENEKRKMGRGLLGSIEDRDIRIRSQCSDAFIMRGSYHMLANRLRVGWHLDFVKRLEKLLVGRE